MEHTDLNGLFDEPIFKTCFCCEDERYCEFYLDGFVYRICAECLKKPDIKKFINKGQEVGMWSNK